MKSSRIRGRVRSADLVTMEGMAEEVSRLLAMLSNAKRLLVLCNLVGKEKSVGELADIVGLSDSALSQHWRNCALIIWSALEGTGKPSIISLPARRSARLWKRFIVCIALGV